MECKISADRILVNETVYEGTAEQAVDTDFTLPDFCPDIGKIFKCDAAARLTSKNVKNGKLHLEGTTKLTVYYLDSVDKKLACCTRDIPFSKEIAVGECPDSSKASVRIRTDYMNCRAVSQRKVDIHGAFSIMVNITISKMNEIVSDAQGGGVKLRQMERQISSPVGSVFSQLSVSEALELSDGKPPIASILSANAAFCVSDIRSIANKVIVKGDMLLKILYRADTDSSAESMEYTIPFNQFFDVTGADDACVCDFFTGESYADIGLRTDSDGEYRRIQADVKADCEIRVYRHTDVSLVTDAYSTQCELVIERKPVKAKKMCSNSIERFVTREKVEIDTSDISAVKDITCRAQTPEITFPGERALMRIPVTATVLTENSEGQYELREVSFISENEVTLPEGCRKPFANICVQVRNTAYSLSVSGIEITVELEASAVFFDDIDISCISSIKPDDSRPKKAENLPAIVLYYADAGEDLWGIAREHNTSVEKIREENGLCEDVLSEPRLLLVTV